MARDWLDILQEMDQWSRDLDRFMTHVYSRSRPMSSSMGVATWNPAVNIYETEAAYLVVVELAGVTPDDINIKYEGNRILVWGQRRDFLPEGIQAVHRMEIELGSFAFLVELPGLVSADGAEANLEIGILQIQLPKQNITGSGTIPIHTRKLINKDTHND